jgi:hypothetical protein
MHGNVEVSVTPRHLPAKNKDARRKDCVRNKTAKAAEQDGRPLVHF